jgi:galactokinase/mevalonate kinase-like predicted kinase
LTVARRHPDQHLQNARFEGGHPFGPDAKVWIENSTIAAGWHLAGRNVVTGAPPNGRRLTLPEGVCVDFVPVARGGLCVRFYGMDDAFRGDLGSPETLLLGRPLADWITRRGLSLEQLGLCGDLDIQDAPLFPVLQAGDWDEKLLHWLWSERPEPNTALRARYLAANRLSATDLLSRADLGRLYAQRAENRKAGLVAMLENHSASVFYHLDLEETARLLADVELPEATLQPPADGSAVKLMHHSMFCAAWRRARGDGGWETDAARAFGYLRECLAGAGRLAAAEPKLGIQEDQIVWARAPLRLDLAGGWSDTPPYCLLHGGKVLNVAVDLNGQPPVQVFARLSEKPELVLRSIDLGTEQRVRTYEELLGMQDASQEFSLARIAVALAGFAPAFCGGRRHAGLKSQLEAFGGGIELSLVAAVPKGSGLGTSSVLAATLLGAISDFCGLGWSPNEIFARTLALEQLLGTGGGWQDQAGGCLHGLKVLETRPGLDQRPTCRWLPDRLLEPACAGEVMLLFYTGITRMARSVLGEIVRGMFLNSGRRLRVVEDIVGNVEPLADAIQRQDIEAFGRCIRTSWELNQALDSGTNPPAVAALMGDIEDLVTGAKLLGAGGGGYLFMVAKDEDAARRIRTTLSSGRHSPKARFVDFSVSQVGLEVTRS